MAATCRKILKYLNSEAIITSFGKNIIMLEFILLV